MRVLLISANTEQINMPVLPLGLACVAAAVRDAGHDGKMLNLMMQEDTRKAIKKAILGFDPELIGISVRNIDAASSSARAISGLFIMSHAFAMS